ncbi:hypothetical protein [Hansschlegelia sp.]|uniref:hypothetical protein n=1 Tax=Hansschlegelia sp. TaxID=2041892 RepID=UPI002BD03C2C|nr:hypothetical protein [Hansschlegelia sp.]HVI29387.1 hypothetical protein [Hansschlegelia sp.]
MKAYRVFPTRETDPDEEQPRTFGRREERLKARKSQKIRQIQAAGAAALALGAGALAVLVINGL